MFISISYVCVFVQYTVPSNGHTSLSKALVCSPTQWDFSFSMICQSILASAFKFNSNLKDIFFN